ncbi:MAG: hypothetical protein FWE72_02840 [Spirochaetaceae bacterium]|nr:hypothetical protein [Spirochaetaceae bacterium]
MKRKVLFCLFFAIILSFIPVYAETVFVYIEKGDIVLNSGINEDAVLWITRIEDGIMDTLFDSGHIVFSNDSGRNQIKDFETLNQLAKSGGAEFLVSAVLNLKIADDAMIISGEYKVYNLFTDDIVFTNNYIFNDPLQRRLSSNIEEKLFLAGQSVGKQIEPTL